MFIDKNKRRKGYEFGTSEEDQDEINERILFVQRGWEELQNSKSYYFRYLYAKDDWRGFNITRKVFRDSQRGPSDDEIEICDSEYWNQF